MGEHTSLLDPIIAVLVVANIMPILPVLLGMLGEVPKRERTPLAMKALLLGNVVAIAFAAGGGYLLGAMHSELDDLRVAGGLILLVFAIYDLLFSREQRREPLSDLGDESSSSEVGLVPLGIPMMVGPATLATALLVAEAYSMPMLLLALLVNGVANAAMLIAGDRLMGLVGHGTIRASGKVFGLLLATLAITMIRIGLSNFGSA